MKHFLLTLATTLLCSSIWGNSSTECARQLTGQLPFIGDSSIAVQLLPKPTHDGEWVGVQCTHSHDEQSPHLTGTHVESFRHVSAETDSLAHVLDTHPEYLQEMEGVHIKVTPVAEVVTSTERKVHENIITFSGGETYAAAIEIPEGKLERIVTAQAIKAALKGYTPKPGGMVLLSFEGGENELKDWPYLTNEAIRTIADLGVSVVALNVPSMDRESDGGRASNHKIFFADKTRLIIETADFREVALGDVAVHMSLDKSKLDVDTAPCASLAVKSMRAEAQRT